MRTHFKKDGQGTTPLPDPDKLAIAQAHFRRQIHNELDLRGRDNAIKSAISMRKAVGRKAKVVR